MSNSVKLLLLLILLTDVPERILTKKITHTKILSVRELKRCGNGTQHISNITIINTGRGRVFLSMLLHSRKFVKRISYITISLRRCLSYSDQGSCEYNTSFKISDNICGKLVEKNQLWTPIAAKIQPKLECPITPVLRNVTEIDISNVSILLKVAPFLGNYYWKMKFMSFDEDGAETLCFVGGGQIVEIISKIQ